MPGLGVLVVFALATARLTVLWTHDEITRPAREGLLRRLNEHRPSHRVLAYWITCPWCLSIELAAVAAPLAYWHGTNPWALIPAIALSFSMVTGVLSGLGRGGE